MINNSLVGNDLTLKYFNEKIADNSLPHAFIIEGGQGSGRHTLVREAAVAIARHGSASRDMIARIESENSPDIIKISLPDGRKTVGVDQVRLIRETLNLVPSELEFKLYILENGELFTVQAQNAALKILEEPPRQTYFFMLTTSASPLLPTVRSRCALIRTARLSEREMDGRLMENAAFAKLRASDPTRYNAALQAADGRLGEAIRRLSNKKAMSEDAADGAELVDSALVGKSLQYLSKLKGDVLHREEMTALINSAITECAVRAKTTADVRLVKIHKSLSDALYSLSENANVSLVRYALVEKLGHIDR